MDRRGPLPLLFARNQRGRQQSKKQKSITRTQGSVEKQLTCKAISASSAVEERISSKSLSMEVCLSVAESFKVWAALIKVSTGFKREKRCLPVSFRPGALERFDVQKLMTQARCMGGFDLFISNAFLLRWIIPKPLICCQRSHCKLFFVVVVVVQLEQLEQRLTSHKSISYSLQLRDVEHCNCIVIFPILRRIERKRINEVSIVACGNST